MPIDPQASCYYFETHYFASQGAGRLGWPLLAGFARLVIAGAGGWVAIHELGAGLPGLFAAIALALVVFGGTLAGAIQTGGWRQGRMP